VGIGRYPDIQVFTGHPGNGSGPRYLFQALRHIRRHLFMCCCCLVDCCRMLRSAERSTLPKFDGAEFLECMKELIRVDRDWVPDSTSSTLYIRPTMIGTDPTLGVTPSRSALLYIITGPVGPYYPTGFKPVSLYADPAHVRSCVGGCGSYKMGANYGPTMYVMLDAVRNHDCQQV